MSTNPANVAAFYTACNNLPTSLAAPAGETPSKSANPVDPSAALEAVANRLVKTWPPDWKKWSLARVKESVADLVWVRQLDEDAAVEGRQQHQARDLFR